MTGLLFIALGTVLLWLAITGQISGAAKKDGE